MANKCVKFFRARDQLGTPVIIHYNGADGYGTFLGGLCSFLVSTFLTIFVTYILIAWWFYEDYDTEVSKIFLIPGEESIYDIPI